MKLRPVFLASLVSLAGTVHAQSGNVTMYGLVDAAIQHTNGMGTAANTSSVNRMISGGLQGSRYGFKGSEDLGGGLKAFFNLENQFTVDTGTNKSSTQAFSRKADLGLSGDFGRVSVGRHTIFAYDVLSELDPMQFANFTPLGNSGEAPVVKFSSFQVSDSRRDNSIKYTKEFGGFSTGLMYAFGEEAGDTKAKSSWGAKLGYGRNKAFNVYLAYDTVNDATGHAATGLVLGANAALGESTLYGGLAQVKNEFKAKGGYGQKNDIWWVGLAQPLVPNLALHLGYYDQKQGSSRSDNGTSMAPAKDGKARTVSSLLDYTLSKRTDVYVAFQHTSLKDGLVASMSPSTVSSNVNTLLMGVRHKF